MIMIVSAIYSELMVPDTCQRQCFLDQFSQALRVDLVAALQLKLDSTEKHIFHLSIAHGNMKMITSCWDILISASP